MKKLVIFVIHLLIFISIIAPILFSGIQFQFVKGNLKSYYTLGNIDLLIKIYAIIIQIWLVIIAIFSVLATLLLKVDSERQKHYENINNNVFGRLKNLTINRVLEFPSWIKFYS